MKSYVNIEQSKKLAEILPIDSADMCYVTDEIEPFWGVVKSEPDDNFDVIPSWSLAALLQIMPHCIDVRHELVFVRYDLVLGKLSDNKGWYVMYDDVNHFVNIYIAKSELVDACVEMILKLNERNLL